MDKKRRHHYVWRKYLEAWVSDGRISCRRDGRIFRAGLKDVALEKDFYRIVELDDREIDFIRNLFVKSAAPIMQEIHNGWIQAFQVGFQFRNFLKERGILSGEIEEQVDIAIHNAEENLRWQIEGKAIPLLESLVKGDTEFYQTDDGRSDFAFFLCEQYTRTPRVKSNVMRSVEGIDDKLQRPLRLDFEKVWHLMRHIVATNIAAWLYSSSDVMKMCLLVRGGDREFITGNQPVVNTFAVGLPQGVAPEELEFYYPVSPNLAVLITKRSGECREKVIGDNEVDGYNRMIFSESASNIYGTSDEALSSYVLCQGLSQHHHQHQILQPPVCIINPNSSPQH